MITHWIAIASVLLGVALVRWADRARTRASRKPIGKLAASPSHDMTRGSSTSWLTKVYGRRPVARNLNATLQKDFEITICCPLRAIIDRG
jgi:hypothetical protein